MEVPVLVVFGSIESLVAPTVLGTTVVADPDVKASVDKLKRKMLLVSEGGDPLSTILVVSVLDKDTTLCGNRGLSRLVRDVVSRQDVVVLSSHSNCLPVVPELRHGGIHSWIG